MTIHTDAREAERALNWLEAYADSGGRERAKAFVESLGGRGELLALSSEVAGNEVYVTIKPSERLTEFLAGAGG